MLSVMRYLLLACLSNAYPVFAIDTTVQLSYATFRGTRLSNGVIQWLGIPFAAPPLGDSRFAPPIDPPTLAGIQKAEEQGPLCIATGSLTVPSGQSEDCLYLAVYAPSSATSTSALPVFVFIQGGGFNSNANPNLNGTGLVLASELNIIVVTFNYRVGPYGFLASSGTSSGRPTANNGLRDQRKAFEWVQQHIASFGGNPNHVVLGGDSAGAASIALHLTAFGGRDDGLFHAAAAESVSFATVLTPAESQYQYDNFSESLGCPTSLADESLACLRLKSAAELQAHNLNIPFPYAGTGSSPPSTAPLYMFNPTLDGDIITDLTYVAFQTGRFINVPVIFGDDTNGGTVFTPRTTSNLQQAEAFLRAQFPFLTAEIIKEILKLYEPLPQDGQSAGDDGWWRWVSDVYGEMRYMCPSLYISSAYANLSSWHGSQSGDATAEASRLVTSFIGSIVSGGAVRRRAALASPATSIRQATTTSIGARSWAYRYNVEDPSQIAQGLGVPHAVELNAIFGPENIDPPSSAPDSYGPGDINAKVVPVIQGYWTSFIRSFDPNTYRRVGSARWEEFYEGLHRGTEPRRLVFQTGGDTETESVDHGQRERCAYLQSIGAAIKQRRGVEVV